MIYLQITRGAQEELDMEIAVGMEMQNFEKLNEDPIWCRCAELTDPGHECM